MVGGGWKVYRNMCVVRGADVRMYVGGSGGGGVEEIFTQQ